MCSLATSRERSNADGPTIRCERRVDLVPVVMDLHICRSKEEPGTMCGVHDDTQYMMNVSAYLDGNKATKYNIHMGSLDPSPFAEWCEDCITSSDMAIYMLGTELA
jgi:hypothetical protein